MTRVGRAKKVRLDFSVPENSEVSSALSGKSEKRALIIIVNRAGLSVVPG
jgi:hypothetical protein